VRRPLIASKTTAVTVGLVLIGSGFYVLWDAWDGRGGKAPWFLRSILPF